MPQTFYSNCCSKVITNTDCTRCPACQEHCEFEDPTARWSECGSEPRNPYRRKIDTEDRLDWFRKYGTSRLPRMAILCAGLEVLDRDCKVAAHEEVWQTLRRVFSPTPVTA